MLLLNSVSWVIFDNYNKYDLSFKKSGRYTGQMLTKIIKPQNFSCLI
jgi:hypothetical protein